MKTQKLDIQTPDGACDCFVAHPNVSKPLPPVILLMDAFGPRIYLYEMAEKLADFGYYVLLPNLFYRTRRAPVIDAEFPLSPEDMPAARAQLLPLFNSFDPEAWLQKDTPALFDFLSKQPEVRPGQLGLTGYCMGGSLALRMASRYPDQIASFASFHAGRLATDAPNSPHLGLGAVKAHGYMAHADHDASLSPEEIKRFQEAIEKAKAPIQTELYTGALHGYTMMDLPAGNPEALARHWQNLVALFQRELS
jgi:carboxymethylenebutenolidase